MLRKILFVLIVSIFVTSTFAAPAKNSIQIKGSDTMVNLGQAWAEKYMEKNPGDFIAVTGGGSGTGFSSLISGTCDIAIEHSGDTLLNSGNSGRNAKSWPKMGTN